VSRNTLATVAFAALAVPVSSACGDEPATPRAAAATATPAAKIAQELIGSWKTRVRHSEIQFLEFSIAGEITRMRALRFTNAVCSAFT